MGGPVNDFLATGHERQSEHRPGWSPWSSRRRGFVVFALSPDQLFQFTEPGDYPRLGREIEGHPHPGQCPTTAPNGTPPIPVMRPGSDPILAPSASVCGRGRRTLGHERARASRGTFYSTFLADLVDLIHSMKLTNRHIFFSASRRPDCSVYCCVGRARAGSSALNGRVTSMFTDGIPGFDWLKFNRPSARWASLIENSRWIP